MPSQSFFKTTPEPYDIARILYHENASVSAEGLAWQQCEKSLRSLSDYDKYYILTHHIRPKEDYKFPLVQKAGHTRKCCISMLSNDYVYSPSSNSIFCLPCSLFVPIDTNKKGLKNRCQLSQFVNIGCQNYKKMHEKQQCHNAAEYHKEACFVAECIKQRFEKPESTIKAQIDCDLKSRYYIYRHVLKRIAQVIHFCGKQGIALRGHIEDSGSPDDNPGNFLALIKMFAAKDTILQDHISKPLLRNVTYIHHRSQNEMIEVIGKSIIQHDLLNEIKEAKIHTILCDEVTSSNDEIMSLCVRFVDAKKQIREEFIEFIHMERITGEVLFEAVRDFYQKNDLRILKI